MISGVITQLKPHLCPLFCTHANALCMYQHTHLLLLFIFPASHPHHLTDWPNEWSSVDGNVSEWATRIISQPTPDMEWTCGKEECLGYKTERNLYTLRKAK